MTEGGREKIQTKGQARMEKNVRSNVTVILIVRHLQTHYATNHLYYVFTAKVARSIRLLNFSMDLNYID
jgi:hypothetical protein